VNIVERGRHDLKTISLAGLLAVCGNGCASQSASLASLNPFAKTAQSPAADKPTGSTGQLASMRQAVAGQANNFNTAAAGAWTKTKDGVTGMFGGKPNSTDQAAGKLADDDPTRLSTAVSVSSDVYVKQGLLWETSGDFTKAMESFDRALKADPSNAAALASIGRLHMRQKNYPQASEFLAKAISLSPNEAALHNDYGMVRAELNDLPGATTAITKALAISPETTRYSNNLAKIRFAAGDAAGALAVLQKHNNPAVAHFNMAYLHYEAKDYPNAKNHLAQVLHYEGAAQTDPSIAQAVSQSRNMLTTIDGGTARLAQTGSAVLSTTNPTGGVYGGQQTATPNQISGQMGGTGGMGGNASFPNTTTQPPAWNPTPQPGPQPGAMAASPAPSQIRSNPFATEPVPQTASLPPSTAGGFTLPPGVFDQTIR
jgi:tetratricopeptide (TPR) repeat protein